MLPSPLALGAAAVGAAAALPGGAAAAAVGAAAALPEGAAAAAWPGCSSCVCPKPDG